VLWFLGSGSTSLKTRLIAVITSGNVGPSGNSEPPRGIAVKSSSVYVARRWSPEIEVYRIGSKATINSRKTYSLDSSWRPDDLVVSFTDNVLCLLGWVASNRQMVLTLSCDTGSILASWPVVKMPCRLSVVSGSQDVLMACQDGLRSYSSSGLLQCFIPVKMNAGSVWHAVQIPVQTSCSHFNRFDVCWLLSVSEWCYGLKFHWMQVFIIALA